MNSIGYASTVTALAVAMLFANNAYSQPSTSVAGGLASGTQYQLIGTDQVHFGPGILKEVRKELRVKLSATDAEQLDADDQGSVWSGGFVFDRIDFLKPGEIRMYDLTDGFSYSAGIEVANTDEFDSQSEIISSRQLGIHYGRLGPENYQSVDLGIRNLSDTAEPGNDLAEDKDLFSLGVTTGRRFELTGLDTSDPLWTVSLRGQFNVTESDNIDEALDNQQWYVSPGLQWSHDSFRLTADVLMPFMQTGELEDDTDYRIRAKIQKNF